MKTLYTAVATANDAGRNGRARTDDGSLDLQDEAEELVALAHERCPYSNATRGNIPVELIVNGEVQ